jgi:hypothetical protein
VDHVAVDRHAGAECVFEIFVGLYEDRVVPAGAGGIIRVVDHRALCRQLGDEIGRNLESRILGPDADRLQDRTESAAHSNRDEEGDHNRSRSECTTHEREKMLAAFDVDCFAHGLIGLRWRPPMESLASGFDRSNDAAPRRLSIWERSAET